MRVEIIAVGTELLLGQVVNTNATFLSEELANLGFEVYFHGVVGDNPKRLEEQLMIAEGRSELVVLCGGLGPTEDDLTRDVVAKHLGEELVLDQMALEKIERHISRSGYAMTENNKRQAFSISGGQSIQNPNGLAVGTFYQKNGMSYLLLPGPPGELIPMFRQKAINLLSELLPQESRLTSRVLRFFGIGESRLVTELSEMIESQINPTIAPYAKPNEVTLRLTAKTTSIALADEMLDKIEVAILEKVGTFFYGYGEDNSLVAETVKLLKTYGKTVTSAESLTVGMFQSELGSISGVSSVYPGGFVTYTNKAKEALLGVPSELILEYGAISEDCALSMARKAREKLGTDYAVGLTGVAGPSKSENQEPGSVWIAIDSKEGGAFALFYQFNRDREYIRHSAVMTGLDLLRRQILKDNQK